MSELISVIVPCYNIENFVSRTVESIINQTYKNLEIILVDDGSKDETLTVLHQLEVTDSRIQVIHKENGGVTRARLTGVAAASGEWIGFVDGDDYIEPDMYDVLLNNAHKFSADISHCGYQMVFPSRVDYYYNTGRLVQQDKLTGMKDLVDGSFIEPGLCNKLFHKSLFHSLLHENVMDYSIKINEDLLMNYYLFREARQSIFYDKCFYHYMVRKGSAATSKISENKLRDPLRVQKILLTETIESQELQLIIKGRITNQLITNATLPYGGQAELMKPYRVSARKELKEMLPELLKGQYSRRIKVLATWAAIFPTSYCWSHKLYSHLRGTDRKYEVN